MNYNFLFVISMKISIFLQLIVHIIKDKSITYS